MTNLLEILSDLDKVTDSFLTNQPDRDRLGKLMIAYLDRCGELPYTDPETIRYAQKVLGRAIIVHAHKRSPVYQELIDPSVLGSLDCLEKTVGKFSVSKNDLLEKESWYTGTFDAFDNRTSGSTGAPFGYRIWKHGYKKVESDRHYRMILKEFSIENPKVLYVEAALPVAYDEVKYGAATIKVADKGKFKNEFACMMCSHGNLDGDYWSIVFDPSIYLHTADYCNFIIEHIQKNGINVLMASGGFFELLTTFLISEENAFPKLVDLLSNTGDRVIQETLDFLKETEITRAWCNHMRCWDGGASFFTCQHGTYHIQDELSYVYSTEEGRLASVDFLSYPSPFINYLNGDYCSVGNEYKRCDCGRWYKEFEFHNRRPRQYLDANGGFYDTQGAIKEILDEFPIKFYSVQDGSISIEETGLAEEHKQKIISEMSKIFVMVYFFKNSALADKVSAMATGCDPPCVAPATCFVTMIKGSGYSYTCGTPA